MSHTTPADLVRLMLARSDPEYAEVLLRVAESGWVHRFGYDGDVVLELADLTATHGPYEAARRKFGVSQ